MLEIFSKKIATWLIKSGILENDNTELYGYAIQYLLLIIIPTINFTAYCIATRQILIGLIEIFTFLLIRKYSGGYHCESSSVCLVFSTIILILISWIAAHLKSDFLFKFLLLLADMELCIKGPVISINHEVSETERKHFHKKLIGIIILLNFIILLLWAFKMTHVFNCISIVILFCSISHVACTIGKNKELYY